MRFACGKCGATVILLCVASSLAWAYSTGPIDGVTGAPGENTCNQLGCHNSFALNSGGGSLVVTAPSQYAPGDTLDLQVGLAQTGQLRWGFELTALDAQGNPVGQLLVVDPARTQKSTALSGRQYIKHTKVGTDSGTVNVAPGWTLRWVAPPSDSGIVTFYAAGNAANGNAISTGDYIYTTSTTTSPVVSPCGVSITGDVNLTGTISSADIIYVVNFVFKGGPDPEPCPASGDVNCTGTVTSADVIGLVNYVFKGGAAPCDVCSLIPGTWTCP